MAVAGGHGAHIFPAFKGTAKQLPSKKPRYERGYARIHECSNTELFVPEYRCRAERTPLDRYRPLPVNSWNPEYSWALIRVMIREDMFLIPGHVEVRCPSCQAAKTSDNLVRLENALRRPKLLLNP